MDSQLAIRNADVEREGRGYDDVARAEGVWKHRDEI